MPSGRRIADFLIDYLVRHQVNTTFMLAGGMMMHLMDAVGQNPGMKYYCNHHEQASAFAADAYARMTGRPALCLATSGPGAVNLVSGIASSWQDSVPVVFLTGQTKTGQTSNHAGIDGLRQFGTFEIDIMPIVRSITKMCGVVTARTAKRDIVTALYQATSGRPGPVLLDVPLDVQGAFCDY